MEKTNSNNVSIIDNFKYVKLNSGIVKLLLLSFGVRISEKVLDIISKNDLIAKNNYYYDANNDEELCNIFNEVDFLIFPSKQDNSPLMVTSAMSCGVCVIAMNNSGLINLLESDYGVLFENNNKEDLINKINLTLKDIEKYREVGRKASVRVQNEYDSKKMYNEYISLYKKLLLIKKIPN